MAGLVGYTLTPVAAEAGAAEGEPRLVYTWAGPQANMPSLVRSYLPSDGGTPRLVAVIGAGAVLGVWDTGTGAFLGALQGSDTEVAFTNLIAYQRPSDGRPRVAAGSDAGRLSIWDGDNFLVLHAIRTPGPAVRCLAVYEEPTSGSTRLVSG
jgi:hypothetical protein